LPVKHYESDEDQTDFRNLARVQGYKTVAPDGKME
jgi:hypothetical protein